MAKPRNKESATLLSSRDIAALNRARAVLERVEETAWRQSLGSYDPFASVTAWDLGRLSEAAANAEGAIFDVLTTARANCGVRVSDTQLHGAEHAEKQTAAQTQSSETETDVGPVLEEAPEAPTTAAAAPVPPAPSHATERARRPSAGVVRAPIRRV